MFASADEQPRVRATRRSWANPAELALEHRRLLFRVARNELAARYAGSVVGRGWIWLAPLLFLAIYGAVYLGIFRARIEGLSEVEYLLFLFSGLVPFLATAEALSAGASSMISNKAVLNNTVFPIELAPVKAVIEAQPSMALGMSVIVGASAILGNLHWTFLLLPVIWGLQILWLIGCAWILAILNAMFRDVQNFLNAAFILLLIASPIAYTPEMVPGALKPLIIANPFAYFVIAYHEILIFGESPSVLLWVAIAIASVGAAVIGSWFFTRAKSVAVDYV